MMLRRSLLALLVLIATSALTASIAVADTGPRWVITATSDPTNLAPGSPSTEVLDVHIEATGGTFVLHWTAQGDQFQTVAIPYDASPEAVQDAITSSSPYTGTNMTVGGAPGDYKLIYPPDAALGSASGEFGLFSVDSSDLTGGAHSATVTPVSIGNPAPTVVLKAINVGGSTTDGSAVRISDRLPAGLTAEGMKLYDSYHLLEPAWDAGKVDCTTEPEIQCTFEKPVDAGESLAVVIRVRVAGPPQLNEGQSVTTDATISGGGAAPADVSASLPVSYKPASFGIEPGSVVAALSDSQAGGHPNLTTAFTLNSGPFEHPAADPKDVQFDVPQGLVGDVNGLPQCSQQAVQETLATSGKSCPQGSLVGTATLDLNSTVLGSSLDYEETYPLYNIPPAPGEPAAFEFPAFGFPVRLDTSVLSNGDYGVRVTAPNLNENGGTVAAVVTVWGVPADHNGPGTDATVYGSHFGGPGSSVRTPLLTSPSQCSEAVGGTLHVDSWSEPGVFTSAESPTTTLTGCGAMPFFSSASMVPDTSLAGEPAGYAFELNVNRSQDTAPEGVAAPDVKDVSVTLPMGTVISPSAANGLGACHNDPNANPAEVPNEFGLHSLELASCERAAQIGTVEIISPDLPEPFGGAVYLAAPECEPCTPQDAEDGRMVKLLLQAKGEGEGGVLVKVTGSLSVNQQTGQMTATFANNPELPFSHLKLTLTGGARAALANPRVCGTATTTVDLTPWSSPFTPDDVDDSDFEVTGCQSPQFAPSFAAGTTSNQAGGFSPFTLSFGRTDADQYLAGLQLRLPPGLLGSLAGVPLCEEPQAAQGICGQASLIGHTQVLTGPGAEPFLVTGGEVFLTGPYRGAPYGLSIVVPAKAGPYTLTGTTGTGMVVVRAAIDVNSETAALTVTSDPLPTILDGIPLQLRLVNVTIDRPNFIFNPTSCEKLQIGATMTSTEGSSATSSSSFQVTNCAALKFTPKFTVSTSGHTSRANGASLDAKVVYPAGAQGTQANIAKVKVSLPKQLPSRLTTLQKACPAAKFEANPGSCPAASDIGMVRASTPLLPVTLVGPVYFVSHGGEAFPSLVVVLQGYGVRVDLTASTFISKAGITSSTFNAIPDVPVNSFELYLPEGSNSALAANGDLCTSKLAMPTVFVAQNGAEIHQSTKIAVTGCPKARGSKRKPKPPGGARARRRGHRKHRSAR